MAKRIRAYFRSNFSDPSLPFEYRLFMIFWAVSIVVSTLSMCTNLALCAGVAGWAMQFLFGLMCIVFVVLPIRHRLRLFRPLLVFESLVYLPYMFFQTAGYDGTDMFFSLLMIFMVTIVFTGRARVAMVTLGILINLALGIIHYLWPQLIVPFAAPQNKLIDLCAAILFSFTGMALLAHYVSCAFAEERSRISELSVRDPLTGSYNRRFLTERLDKALAECERTKEPLSVLMMDLDHFKLVNDNHGHGFGDEVLKRFNIIAQSKLREYDVLARYGGEEFVSVLQHLDLQQAQEVAERIRSAVEAESFTSGDVVTVSIGVAEYQPGESRESLLDRADAQLYHAKRSGRNCVCA